MWVRREPCPPYEFSTIAYKFYPEREIPTDEEIATDLDAVLSSYDKILDAEREDKDFGSSVRSWIFQANPAFFDIDGALQKLENLTWLVKQHAEEISKDDEVFLWRSGPKAGIVATAVVTSKPEMLREDEAEIPFILEADKFDGPQLRVRLKIQNRVDPTLSRDEIKTEPRLRDLSIIKASQGTNFPVSLDEATALTGLLEKSEHPISPGSRRAGQRVWLIAPGRNAEHWDEFYRDGLIAIGWDELGDLRHYQNVGELTQKIGEIYEREQRPTNDALACFEFANTMQPGDLLFAKQGRSTIVGYGAITGDYEPDGEKSKR